MAGEHGLEPPGLGPRRRAGAGGDARAADRLRRPRRRADDAHVGRARSEFVYFALRNTKFVIGLGVVLPFLLLALVGPLLTDHTPLEFTGPTDQPPSSEYWLGTTSSGQDVYAQFVYGLRAAFLVGTLGGGIAALLGMAVGFTAGYRGGWIDDVLNMLTNVVLVIPTLAILIIVAAYLRVQSYATEAILIGLTSWPWAARAIRAQTFSLKTREFVDVARLSGRSTRQIIASEIASNMSSYLFMMFILLFGGAILIGASLDFLGLGPSASISLGLMMNNAVPRERAAPRQLVVVHPAGYRHHRRSSAGST